MPPPGSIAPAKPTLETAESVARRLLLKTMNLPSPPVEPKPAASVVLVRPAPPGASEAIEVYMIRRQRSMKFLGGFYAFPGGKVDPADGAPAALARCRGLDTVEAETILLGSRDTPALAFWVAAVRELLESGLAWVAQFHSIEELWAAHADGRPKFDGIIDRLDASWESFDWKQNRFPD